MRIITVIVISKMFFFLFSFAQEMEFYENGIRHKYDLSGNYYIGIADNDTLKAELNYTLTILSIINGTIITQIVRSNYNWYWNIIDIPDSVTSIGEAAFAFYNSLNLSYQIINGNLVNKIKNNFISNNVK